MPLAILHGLNNNLPGYLPYYRADKIATQAHVNVKMEP
jgi:hypothetical protein